MFFFIVKFEHCPESVAGFFGLWEVDPDNVSSNRE